MRGRHRPVGRNGHALRLQGQAMTINDVFTVISGTVDIIILGLAIYVVFFKKTTKREEEEEVTTS